MMALRGNLMKKLLLLLTMLVGLAMAQTPAYPENTFGVGYTFGQGLGGQVSLVLPFAPLGLDTGLDLEGTYGTDLRLNALTKINLLPALTLADLSLSVGLGVQARYPLGIHLGPVASLEIPGGVISAFGGLGYQEGFHTAWGLGLRLYLDPLALEFASSDRYDFKMALLYLW